MRGHINPHLSSAHRVACLTLYRGLLEQSARLKDAEIASIVTGHVRRRFRLDKSAQSISVICNGLSLGRKYFDIIRDAADGSESAKIKLQDTVAAVERYSQNLKALRVHQSKLRGPTRPSKLKRIAHYEKTTHKEWAKKIPNPIPIFDRPVPKERLPSPDKPRRVPYLVSGQGVPFLRYKSGSTPIELGRTIRSMYNQEFHRWENIYRLQQETDHASLEDEWDKETAGYPNSQNNAHEQSSSWCTASRNSEHELQSLAHKATEKRRATAQRMFNIARQERELAIKEREERKQQATMEQEEQRKSEKLRLAFKSHVRK